MSDINKLQKFETIEIHRSELKNAEYNPRKISKANEKNLRKALKKHGLVIPIVWNKNTGNIVGGHQRLDQIDQISKTDDYNLTVAAINVDEKEEAEINVLLNNKNLQGSWDSDMLDSMIKDFELDPIDNLIFDKFELEHEHGIYLDEGSTQSKESMEFNQAAEDAFSELGDAKSDDLELQREKRKEKAINDAKVQKKEQYEEIKEQRESGNHELSADTRDYNIDLIFDDNKQKQAFLKKNGFNGGEKYVRFSEISYLL